MMAICGAQTASKIDRKGLSPNTFGDARKVAQKSEADIVERRITRSLHEICRFVSMASRSEGGFGVVIIIGSFIFW